MNLLEKIKIDKEPIKNLEDTISYIKNEIAIRANRIYDLYWELLYSVNNKSENETRHETVLRYIENAENKSDKVEIEVDLLKKLRDDLAELINTHPKLGKRDQYLVHMFENELKEVDKLL